MTTTNSAYIENVIAALVEQRNAALDTLARVRAENAVLTQELNLLKSAEAPPETE